MFGEVAGVSARASIQSTPGSRRVPQLEKAPPRSATETPRVAVNRGDLSTEFGEKPVSGRVELLARYSF